MSESKLRPLIELNATAAPPIEGVPDVHQSNSYSGKSRLKSLIEQAEQADQAEAELGSIGQEIRRSSTPAPVHKRIGLDSTPQLMNDAGITPDTPQADSSAVLDPLSRKQLGRDMGTAARIALETGASVGVMGPARRVLAKTAAGPFLKRAGEAAAVGSAEGIASLVAYPFDPVDDPFGRARSTALFGALADGIASNMIAGIRTVKAGGSELTPGARTTMRVLGDKVPTAGRLSKSGFFDIAENFVENSLAGSSRVRNRNAAASLRAQELVEENVKRYTQGASRQEINNLVREVTKESRAVFTETAEALYSKIDDLDMVGVETSDIISLRNELVREHQKGAKSPDLNQLVVAIDRTIGVPKGQRGIEANVMISTGSRRRPRRPSDPNFKMFPGEPVVEPGVAKSITFRDAARLRSDMIRYTRSSNDPFPDIPEGASKRISSTVDTSMSAAAAQLDDAGALERWRTANQFWKDGSEAFGSSVMRALGSTRPDDLFNAIIQADSPQQIAAFRKMVLGGTGGEETTAREIRKRAQRTLRSSTADDAAKEAAQRTLKQVDAGEKAWTKFQGLFLTNILRGADKGSSIGLDDAVGTRILVASKALDRWNSFGDEALAEVFPKRTQRQQAERLLRVLEITQAGTGRPEGTFATQMLQVGAIFQIASKVIGGKVNPASLLILAGPLVLGRLMDNPKFIRWATVGSKAKPGSDLGIRAFQQMALIAAREGAELKNSDGETMKIEETKELNDLRDLQSVTRARSVYGRTSVQ